MKSFQFPHPETPHWATVRNKTRNSGLTSVCYVDEATVICADFNEKTVYLVDISGDDMVILDQHPTQIADGTPVQTDLMDFSGDRFVVSNFYQGSFSLFRLVDGKIQFEKEFNHNDYTGLHGVRFVPGADDLVWLTYCGNKNKSHQVFDLKAEAVLHHFDTDQQCQDVAFLGDKAVVFARTDHIKGGKSKANILSKKWKMFATAYVYQIPKNIRTDAPKYLSRWKGKGHIDAVKAYGDHIYAANQFLNRIDVFSLSDQTELTLTRHIDGFSMPHGLDLRNDRLVVTNYKDQTLRLLPI